jgi:hypothetical protein
MRREAALEYSPGLQPWVTWLSSDALKVASDVGATGKIHTPRPRTCLSRPPLSGRFICPRNPGLKPWAILYSRFAAKSDREPGQML